MDLANNKHISSPRILYIRVAESESEFLPNRNRNNYGLSSSTCPTPHRAMNVTRRETRVKHQTETNTRQASDAVTF